MPETHDNLPLVYDWDAGENVKAGMDDNLRMLGVVVQLSVKSRTANEPGSPSNGDRYIHNGDASWSTGSAGDIIARIADAWYAFTPKTGWWTYVEDEQARYEYDGGWSEFEGGGGSGDASVWRDGSGAPSDALGDNGDYYLDNDTGDVYSKGGGTYSIVANIAGPQGPAGADGDDGADGADGSVWRDGSGAPSDSLGENGDFYLDNDSGDVYEKAGGSYSVIANIEGPQGPAGADGDDGADGADGSVWRDGSGAPSDSLGENGDFYLDNDSGDVYEKAGGTYSVVANIKGPEGSGASSLTDTSTSTVYKHVVTDQVTYLEEQ